MRHEALDPKLFIENRARLAALLPPRSIAVLNANDVLPTNADGTFALRQNSDLLHLTGVEQEETMLLLFPSADDAKLREVLFLRQPSEENQLWEGRKLGQDEAHRRTGIRTVKWTSEFWNVFHRLVCEAEQVFLNTNEHKRANCIVPTRDDRFVAEVQRRYPLHSYRRLAPLMHQLRSVKSSREIAAIDRACQLTGQAFQRVLRLVKPGLNEADVEAEFAHEFIRHGGRFAYDPIVATGGNACVLHYGENSAPLKKGQLLLLDVAAAFANYNSDLTRTIPVSGRFTKRQRQVYDAVLRVNREMTARLRPGLKPKDWQKESEALMTEELLGLGLLKPGDIRRQDPDWPAVKRYFMHGLGHPIGLDVHDVGDMAQPIAPGWVLTVEPGIYIPDEQIGIRLENTVLVTERGPVNLMANIPIEAEEIEDAMADSAS
jgi:Xaa-Pro aminopeptidase